MTGNDKVTLKYSLDKSNILTTYADGLDFTDVILVSNEHKHYKVYKILSACSHVLKLVLMENQHNVTLPNIHHLDKIERGD